MYCVAKIDDNIYKHVPKTYGSSPVGSIAGSGLWRRRNSLRSGYSRYLGWSTSRPGDSNQGRPFFRCMYIYRGLERISELDAIGLVILVITRVARQLTVCPNTDTHQHEQHFCRRRRLCSSAATCCLRRLCLISKVLAEVINFAKSARLSTVAICCVAIGHTLVWYSSLMVDVQDLSARY